MYTRFWALKVNITYSLHSPFSAFTFCIITLPSQSLPDLSLPSSSCSIIPLGKMMSINNNNNNRLVVGQHPPSCFSASQWQELEHQALVFKYIVSGIPVPPDLLRTSCSLLHNNTSHTHLIGSWNRFEMGRKIDTEPGRCRRTDGKKWRCSKEAYPDSKYCERHMHRGRNRSTSTSTSSRKQITPPSPNPNPIVKNTLPHFLSKYSSGFSPQQDVNFHFLQQPDSGSTVIRSSISSTDRNDIKHDISTPFQVVGDGKQQHGHPEKVVHRFLDEWSPEDEQGSIPDRTTQLSTSIPNYLHDFFTPKWYD